MEKTVVSVTVMQNQLLLSLIVKSIYCLVAISSNLFLFAELRFKSKGPLSTPTGEPYEEPN